MTVTVSVTYGYSLCGMWLQPLYYTVTASVTYGYSLCDLRFQPTWHLVRKPLYHTVTAFRDIRLQCAKQARLPGGLVTSPLHYCYITVTLLLHYRYRLDVPAASLVSDDGEPVINRARSPCNRSCNPVDYIPLSIYRHARLCYRACNAL